MRSFVITLIVLVAVVAGALATAPWLIDWNDYRGALTRQAEAITGSAVTIEGRISFRLLPTPTLTLARTKLTGGSQAAGHMLLVIDRLDLQLRALPLLRGQVQVGDVRLVRPILQLDMAPDEALRLPPTGRHPILSLVAIEPDHLTVVDGHIRLQGEEAAWQLDEVALEAVAESPNGPFALDGGFTLDARPFELDAQIGQPGPDGAGSLQLELTADDAASLLFRGAVWWDRADPRLRGEVTLAGDDARSSIALVGDALRRAMPPMPPWLDQPFDIAANLRLDRSRLLLDELRLAVAGMEADGELDLALGPSPRIALGLRAQRLVLTDPLQAGPADLAFLTALPAALHGEIDLSVAALEYRGRATSRVRLRLMLTGDGEVAVEQASAILPGQTDVRFAGRVAGEGETVALQGDVSAVTDDLSALLAWLDIEPPGVAAGRLRTLSLASALVIDRDTVRFSQAELRVDATQLRGSLDLAIGAATAARPRIEAAVVLDRLNIDAYQADLRPADAARLLQRALQSVDAAIEARIERLTWRGLYMRDLAVALRAEDGRLVLSEGSIELAGEARALLQGQIDLGSGAFTWNGELHTARPGRLLRRLDLTTPLMLTRMSPLTVTATARGRSDAFDLEVEIDDGEGRLTATGDAGWVEGDPRYNLELELSHPDYGALFRALGARTPAPDAAAPLSVTGKVIRNAASEHTIVGSARIDAMTLTGLIAWQQGAERPSVEMQLSVGDPSQEILTGLLALAGVSPSPVRLDAPLLGNLPREALPFGWLARFDGELRLSAKGGLAGKGIEMHARVQDRKLFVERCLVELDHGTADVELILDTDRPLPFLTAAIDLRRVDAAWLAGLLDLEPVIEGAADLTSELTAVGTSPYELVRSTIGRIELTIGDGRLIGDDIATIAQALSADNADPAFDPQVPVQELLPIEPGLAFSDLAGRFALDRGMARTGSTTLDLDGAEGRISGVIDLLLWVADLTLEVEPPASAPIELRIVGPLQEPQTRLVIPEALPQPRKRNGPLSWDRSSSRGAPARRTPRR